MKSSTLIWGAGSQALIVVHAIRQGSPGSRILVFDPTNGENVNKSLISEFPPVTCIDVLTTCLPELDSFVVCIGAEWGFARVMTAAGLEKIGLRPMQVLQGDPYIHPSASLGKGCMVMAGAKIQQNVSLGAYCMVNTGAIVDHECELGAGVHIMGGAVITGRVLIGDYATVGANATILPDLQIGDDTFVGAGAVVTKSIPPGVVVSGCPARIVRKRERGAWLEEPIGLLLKNLESRNTDTRINKSS